jgi:predicted RNA-binding protein (virulence factor B family)
MHRKSANNPPKTIMEIGKIYTCRMVRIESDGLLMETLGEDPETILVKPDLTFPFSEGKTEKVFLWLRDAEGRWWGSLKIPHILLNDVEFLRIAAETQIGFFLDWGLEKQLFCPLSHVLGMPGPEMIVPVRLLLDEKTGRLMGSMKWKKNTVPADDSYYRSKEVEILIMEPVELGFSVLIDKYYLGLVYSNQTFKPLRTGQKLRAFVNKVREDGRLDILLQRPGYGEIDNASDELLSKLKEANGKLLLGDKSDPELINSQLGMSKKTFKKALGALFREGRIGMNETSFWLLGEEGD